MKKRNNKNIIRIIAMLLAITLVLPVGVKAAVVEPVQPRGSYYLDSYNAYIYPAGGGKIQVYYSVFGCKLYG